MEAPARYAVGSGVPPLVTSNNPAVIVSAIKLADDRSGDVVVRIYESRGGRALAELAIDVGELSGVVVTDLIERDLHEVEVQINESGRNSITVALRPFEVRTFRLRRLGSAVAQPACADRARQ